ncbi:MAG: glycosyltransferase [Planctomycetes bacterium]|nr:glycosyltransferase [Planctomycetota bacterium]
MTQFIITALGSYGDVHPMVGLGESLIARGHHVKIVANPYFEDVVRGAGLTLLPVGTREQYIELSQHPDLWHPTRGPQLVLGMVAGELLRPLYEIVSTHYVPGETVFCAHGLDLASRTASEVLTAPLAAVHLAPGMIWSLDDPPRLKGGWLGPGVPRWLKRLQLWIAESLFVDPLLCRPLNQLRSELGLPPIQRLFTSWLSKADVVLCLFPDWFGVPQADWPANTRPVGFPLWDSPGSASLPEVVREFLAAGEPPIAFSPGSANKEAHRFFAAAVESCGRLGRRGILLTKYDHQLPARLPDSVRHFGFVPLSQFLPQTAAFVHHGGIGSCAQGLAAGVPQLVRPMSFDQFDNSRRLIRLGVAEELSVKRFRGKSIAAAVERLLTSPAVATRCCELANCCDGLASRGAACDALEQLAALSGATQQQR